MAISREETEWRRKSVTKIRRRLQTQVSLAKVLYAICAELNTRLETMQSGLKKKTTTNRTPNEMVRFPLNLCCTEFCRLNKTHYNLDMLTDAATSVNKKELRVREFAHFCTECSICSVHTYSH